jgi:hypothetical protein
MSILFKVTIILESESVDTKVKMEGALERAILDRFEWISVKSLNAEIITAKELA